MDSLPTTSVKIEIYVAAKSIENITIGMYKPFDNKGEVTTMRYGVIGFHESYSEACSIDNPVFGKTYEVYMYPSGSDWVPQLELRVKVEGRELYAKYMYLDNIDWDKLRLLKFVVTKEKHRTYMEKEELYTL